MSLNSQVAEKPDGLHFHLHKISLGIQIHARGDER